MIYLHPNIYKIKDLSTSASRKEKLKKLPHIMAGVLILLHAFERWDSGHTTYWFFLISGIVFLSVALLHHRLLARFPFVDTLFFVIEGMLSLIIAWEYHEAGKHAIPYMYVLAALLQLTAVFVFYKRKKRAM